MRPDKREFRMGLMVAITISLGIVVIGCKAMNSLIVHPLKVLHRQHEQNEK